MFKILNKNMFDFGNYWYLTILPWNLKINNMQYIYIYKQHITAAVYLYIHKYFMYIKQNFQIRLKFINSLRKKACVYYYTYIVHLCIRSIILYPFCNNKKCIKIHYIGTCSFGFLFWLRSKIFCITWKKIVINSEVLLYSL